VGAFVLLSLQVRPRNTPRRAAAPEAGRRASRLCVSAFVQCWFCVGGGSHTRAAAMRTPAPKAMALPQ
jgi:hypothetical protein